MCNVLALWITPSVACYMWGFPVLMKLEFFTIGIMLKDEGIWYMNRLINNCEHVKMALSFLILSLSLNCLQMAPKNCLQNVANTCSL